MQIGFSTISCPEYSIARIGEAAREFGYDAVELYGLGGEKLQSADYARHRAAFRSALAGTAVASVTCWRHLGTPNRDRAGRDADVAEMRAILDVAAEFGSPYVKIFGGELPEGEGRQAVLAEMRDVLGELWDLATSLGVGINIETHDTFSRAGVLAELLAMLPAGAPVGTIWDIQHPHRLGESVDDVEAAIGPTIRHAHFKDAVRRPDGWRHVPLGEGELPVEPALQVLHRHGFAGCVSFDWGRMWTPDLESADLALPRYANRMRRLIADLGAGADGR